MKKKLFILALAICFSCKKEQQNTLKIGTWRAEIKVMEGEILPFNFEVTSAHSLKIFNADEVIFVDDITYRNDSVFINMPSFDGFYIAANLLDGKFEGEFIEESRDRIVSIKAEFGQSERFEVVQKPETIWIIMKYLH